MVFGGKSDHKSVSENDTRMESRGELASLRTEIPYALMQAAKTSSRDIDWLVVDNCFKG